MSSPAVYSDLDKKDRVSLPRRRGRNPRVLTGQRYILDNALQHVAVAQRIGLNLSFGALDSRLNGC